MSNLNPTDTARSADPKAWHRRLHSALMPDYNRAATIYWWSAVVAGLALLLYCLLQIGSMPRQVLMQIAVAVALALAAGLFPVRIGATKVSFAAGELFIFAVLLLHGAPAAAVVAACEAAVGSYRSSRRWTSRLGSPAMATLAMWACGSLFDLARDRFGLSDGDRQVPLLALAMALALLYFLCSATLMSGVSRLRRGDHLLQLGDVVSTFHWVGMAYAGSAMFAALVYLAFRQVGGSVLAVMSPLVMLLLVALHYYFQQQEIQHKLAQLQAASAEQQAAAAEKLREIAARHLQELQLSERRFRGAFTYASIGMLLMEFGGAIVQANEAMAQLLGRPENELQSKPFSSFVHPDDRPLFAAKLANALSVDFEPFNHALRLLDAEGTACPVQLHCSYFRGPAVHGEAVSGRPCLFLQVQGPGLSRG